MGCWGDPSHCPHPGQAGGLAWRAGASANSKRHCQLSATSLLPPSFQPRHNWLQQPHITNKRLLTTNEVLRKALGSCPAASGGSCCSHCRRTGGMLLPTEEAPSMHFLPQPPNSCTPHLSVPRSPKHCREGSLFPQCHLIWPERASGCGCTRVPGRVVRVSANHPRQLRPNPVGTFSNLLLNGM